MISHKHKFILITPPKTASTSLVKSLMPFIEVEKIIPQGGAGSELFDFKEPGLKSRNRKHAKLASYGDRFLQEYKLYGVVRNPYDRMVSWWKMGGGETFHAWLNEQEQWVFAPCSDYFDSKGIGEFQVLRFENLEIDFNKFCNELNIPDTSLVKINKTKHKHYTEYYDDETRQIVAEKYAKDIEHFGYKFGE